MNTESGNDFIPPDIDFLFDFLKQWGITYQREDHPAVFTVEESKSLSLELQGAPTKNLFLRDKNGKRHFLLSVEQDKPIDLKQLPSLLDSSRLSFGSAERLWKHLGVLPGAVSLLALINDSLAQVEVYIDEDLWDQEAILCHPLINSSTLALKKFSLERFLQQTGHTFQLVKVPQPLAIDRHERK
ncbi:MAG: prolyl-tRNA synthetase associated domain-containing protein [Planctomycetota bacterium]|nr:prolyl-tRNA synthetase associated domain-containing protein [Planctomycetota bacterium]